MSFETVAWKTGHVAHIKLLPTGSESSLKTISIKRLVETFTALISRHLLNFLDAMICLQCFDACKN